MSIILTGGAGFIGSCLLRELNDYGRDDIVVVDNIASTEKWKNLRNKRFIGYVHKDDFLTRLMQGAVGNIDIIIHMGACSSTTEINFDYLWRNNVEYTKSLWRWCADNEVPLIYASSAATYGDGSHGFDDKTDIDILEPLNGYGYSKQVFDQWTLKQDKCPPQHVGLKFFNVYGPNEYHKESMASMVFHGFKQIKKDGEIRLFKSCNPKYADGQQLRDFVYVKDVCKVVMFFVNNRSLNGIFNVGTGKAESFLDLANAVFEALDLEPNVRYIDMPESIKEKYQYYTKADIDLLRNAGYMDEFKSIRAGVFDYVTNHLSRDYGIY